MKVRNESLDCLKGIAILLVMFGHVQVHNQMTDPYLYDVIKSLQMPLFFLISGYLAGAGTKILDPAQYRDRMRRRAAAYLLPFFSWLAVQHITYVPRAVCTVLFQLDYGLWFLMVLFLFTWLVYTAQLMQAKVKREWGFWLVFLGGGALILLAYLAGVTFLSPSLLVVYLPYYTAAYFCGSHPEFIRKWMPEGIRRAGAYAGSRRWRLSSGVRRSYRLFWTGGPAVPENGWRGLGGIRWRSTSCIISLRRFWRRIRRAACSGVLPDFCTALRLSQS